jgi:anti-sigma factor RsiW
MVSCKEVWRRISDYLDDDVAPGMRAEIEAHLAVCRHCSAMLDSTRKVLIIVGDERVFEVPVGYSERLHKALAAATGEA